MPTSCDGIAQNRYEVGVVLTHRFYLFGVGSEPLTGLAVGIDHQEGLDAVVYAYHVLEDQQIGCRAIAGLGIDVQVLVDAAALRQV